MFHTGWWPTFNLADVFITIGVAWWIGATIWSPNAPNTRLPTQS
jgi:signal peptidase II